MKWVLGTGRCGMHNYTALQGGFIQSPQDWKKISLDKFHGKPYDKAHVFKVLKRRKNLKVPCVADCAQFMFIEEILGIDRDATFVWLKREKNACVASFMKKGGEDNRIHPAGWVFSNDNKKKLLEWYYDQVNAIIERGIKNSPYEIVSTEDMKKASEDEIDALRIYA